VRSGNDFNTREIKRARFDSGGYLLKQGLYRWRSNYCWHLTKLHSCVPRRKASYSCWIICVTVCTTLASIDTWFQTRGTRTFYESSGVRVRRKIKNHWCRQRHIQWLPKWVWMHFWQHLIFNQSKPRPALVFSLTVSGFKEVFAKDATTGKIEGSYMQHWFYYKHDFSTSTESVFEWITNDRAE